MTDSPSLSFGEELRRERIIRDISLEEISQTTKISVRLLKALEASNVKTLPAPTFTRGFIRAYSKHLGIDPEEKVNAYLADLAGDSPEAPLQKKARPRSRFWRGRRSTAGTIVGVVTAVLVLLGLIAGPGRRVKASQARLVARSEDLAGPAQERRGVQRTDSGAGRAGGLGRERRAGEGDLARPRVRSGLLD